MLMPQRYSLYLSEFPLARYGQGERISRAAGATPIGQEERGGPQHIEREYMSVRAATAVFKKTF